MPNWNHSSVRLKNEKRHHLFEELVVKSWWLILFFLLCFFIYDHALIERKKSLASLVQKREKLLLKKEKALKLNEELKLQRESENDPAFIELTLMKSLGLVAENQTKVIFKKN